MSCIVSALVPYYIVVRLGQHVDDLPFTLISPLESDDQIRLFHRIMPSCITCQVKSISYHERVKGIPCLAGQVQHKRSIMSAISKRS